MNESPDIADLVKRLTTCPMCGSDKPEVYLRPCISTSCASWHCGCVEPIRAEAAAAIERLQQTIRDNCYTPGPKDAIEEAVRLRMECATAHARIAELMDLCESAWGVIANVNMGDWLREPPCWQQLATQWSDKYHAAQSAPAKGVSE